MLRMYASPLLLLLLVAPAVSGEETIWLRGRGSDVWIERGDAAREPRDERKGVTRVATPPAPAVSSRDTDERSRSAVVVLEGPHWTHADAYYEHEYTPRFYYPRYSYRLYPFRHSRYRYARPWSHPYPGYRSGYRHGHSYFPRYRGLGFGRPGGGFGGRPHGHGLRAGGPVYRNAGPYGGSVRSGGYVERGGAYRRAR